MDSVFIKNLQNQLASAPLPGLEGQMKMAPPMRRELAERYLQPAEPKLAAVLVLLFWKENDWHLALIERTSGHPEDRHAGQISFPGGKLDPSDENLAAAALREAEEETGVLREKIELLGRLTELYIPVSGFLVHPFVGYLEEGPAWSPQPAEVRALLEVPLSFLREEGARLVRDLAAPNGSVYQNIPLFEIEDRAVWGATAMILSEFLEVVEEAGVVPSPRSAT